MICIIQIEKKLNPAAYLKFVISGSIR
jgi:hypothetical protein